MPATAQQYNSASENSPLFHNGYKLSFKIQAELWQILQLDLEAPTRALQSLLFSNTEQASVTVRQLNRVRKKWGVSRKRGRPFSKTASGHKPAEVIQFKPIVPAIGLQIFSIWLESQPLWETIAGKLSEQISSYRQAHPEADFPLLHHSNETLIKRFKALFFAPLLGIKRLIEYDRRQHVLKSIIGRSYQSSTLNQYLGQLDRIGATIPVIASADDLGKLNYVDGHMIAYWGKQSMHKGKITMLGRVMPGSQAVITHNENGQATFVDYYQPDIHLTKVIVDYCQSVSAQTNGQLFIIDRAINSVAIAKTFDESNLGLLSMLNDSDHKGLESFEYTLIDTQSDGTEVYSASWKIERSQDPRHFVITLPVNEKLLVYWGTKVFSEGTDKKDWPTIYRTRNHLQENSFKNMIAHGALNVNYGHKKTVVPDRHQQRKREALETKSTNNQIKLAKKVAHIEQKQAQVLESQEKKHKKRLKQRERKLAQLTMERNKLESDKNSIAHGFEKLGKPKKRHDRDLTKQLIMTARTLLLENMLTAFNAVLISLMSMPLSLEMMLTLFFDRSGFCIEKADTLIYYINKGGLSAQTQRLLLEIIQAINSMNLQFKEKIVQIRIRGKPS